jgi:hypothetical protein
VPAAVCYCLPLAVLTVFPTVFPHLKPYCIPYRRPTVFPWYCDTHDWALRRPCVAKNDERRSDERQVGGVAPPHSACSASRASSDRQPMPMNLAEVEHVSRMTPRRRNHQPCQAGTYDSGSPASTSLLRQPATASSGAARPDVARQAADEDGRAAGELPPCSAAGRSPCARCCAPSPATSALHQQRHNQRWLRTRSLYSPLSPATCAACLRRLRSPPAHAAYARLRSTCARLLAACTALLLLKRAEPPAQVAPPPTARTTTVSACPLPYMPVRPPACPACLPVGVCSALALGLL